jgi:hypothetical protein
MTGEYWKCATENPDCSHSDPLQLFPPSVHHHITYSQGLASKVAKQSNEYNIHIKTKNNNLI